MMARILLGIDTGGTFTDFVAVDGTLITVHKLLSTPAAPEAAIMAGIEALGLLPALEAGDCRIVHGTTVATNAVLEGHGARTVYVSNRGLGDVLRIGRQTRAELYNLTPLATDSPIDQADVVEVDARLGADGQELVPLTSADITQLVAEIDALAPEAIAINLLFSFVDDSHERQIEAALEGRYFVSRSSWVLPEYREYERGVATWLNAWLGPRMDTYLTALNVAVAPSRLAIMQSSGLSVSAEQASRRAVNLLLSGPVGGLRGAGHMSGGEKPANRLMTFDMGGTSTDVALMDGGITLTSEGHVARFPVAVPMADIHTIGAGGGSIASVDAGGLLHVGPASAGADPGPACYGRGGTEPTVTDANLYLGRLLPDAFLGGRMTLDRDAAKRALERVGTVLGLSPEALAFGIVELANEHMTQALRAISIERGFDPQAFTLVCFGGAGGLHFCALAEALGMDKALLPRHAGVLSALGMLVAPPGRELSRTVAARSDALDVVEVEARFARMIQSGTLELAADGVEQTKVQSFRSVDCRYVGQTFTLNLPWEGADKLNPSFHQAHEARYGHRLDKPVEVLNIRVSLRATIATLAIPSIPATGQLAPGTTRLAGHDNPVAVYRESTLYAGAGFAGPALLVADHATAFVPPGWTAEVDAVGNVNLAHDG